MAREWWTLETNSRSPACETCGHFEDSARRTTRASWGRNSEIKKMERRWESERHASLNVAE